MLQYRLVLFYVLVLCALATSFLDEENGGKELDTARPSEYGGSLVRKVLKRGYKLTKCRSHVRWSRFRDCPKKKIRETRF